MPGEHETFGLVALEAAACGAQVACCRTAPAAAAIGRFAHTFAAGDVAGLAAAVEAARAAQPDPAAAAELGWRHRWPRVLGDELAALRRLAGR
jgi:alpha-1,6-mannosyltransferase